MSMVTVRALDDHSLADWDRFVMQHPNATFFHRAGWKAVIEEVFGARCYFLQAWSFGRTTGVLPLAHVRSRLFGNALISSAYTVYGGPIAHDESSIAALDAAAMAIARQLNVDYVEYRQRTPSGRGRETKSSLYVTFRKYLNDPTDLSFIPRKRRASLRKAQSLALTNAITPDVDAFYALYARNKRDLGTPAYPKSYFNKLIEAFGSDCEISFVGNRSGFFCGVLSFYFRDEVLPYFSGATDEARFCCANDLLYWNLMCRASQRGAFCFDFGRSKVGTGSFRYKELWGFEPQFLNYEFALLKRNRMPDLSPLSPRYRWLTSLWKRLPLPIANYLGPLISRGLA
jgi:FemAB-related protein (PEP-CTERM system-associated)